MNQSTVRLRWTLATFLFIALIAIIGCGEPAPTITPTPEGWKPMAPDEYSDDDRELMQQMETN